MPTKSEARNRISNALGQISQLSYFNRRSPEFMRWRRSTEIAISNTFGDNSRHTQEFYDISFSPSRVITGMDNSVYVRAYERGLGETKALLESMVEEIEEYWPDEISTRAFSETPPITERQVSNRIFVVHGRDDGTRNTIARFLENLELEPVILQELPSEGRTVIEKFEDHSGVDFAVVLCTPDDVGALDSERDNFRSRPRQNVVLELGFFLGTLGRNRVCALLDGDMDMPSDYGGVLYILLDDSRGWKLTLARELRAAGMTIDMNLIV